MAFAQGHRRFCVSPLSLDRNCPRVISMDTSKRTIELPMTVPELNITVYLLPEMAWPFIKQNVANTQRAIIVLIIPYYFTLRGVFFLCNRSPKGNVKPELNHTPAIYPPEGPKPKVYVTTTIIWQSWKQVDEFLS